MKRILAFILCLLFLGASVPVYASDNLDFTGVTKNALKVVDKITIETNARTTDKSATRTREFCDGDTLIAVISFRATFRYDGTNVIVIYRNVTQTDTYNGWSYTQESFNDSGGTVTLTGKLKYLQIFSTTTFTMSMTCDANGNISY